MTPDQEHAAVLRQLLSGDDSASWLEVAAAIERAIELLEREDAEWAGPGMGSA